jgi:hypothetical protein
VTVNRPSNPNNPNIDDDLSSIEGVIVEEEENSRFYNEDYSGY